MTIYRITIVDLSNNSSILFQSNYHTDPDGPYKEAIDKGAIKNGEPIDKDHQIIPDTKILITD